jgi:hypothetical protein
MAIGIQTSVNVIIALQLDRLLTCNPTQSHIILTEKIEILKITKSMAEYPFANINWHSYCQ